MKILFDLYKTIKSSKLSQFGNRSIDGVYCTKDSFTVTNGHFLISVPRTEEHASLPENALIQPNTKTLNTKTLTLTAQDEQYPIEGMELIKKRVEKNTLKICLNADYIKEIASILLKNEDTSHLTFILDADNPGSNPILIQTDTDTRTAILMPVAIKE